MPCVSAKRQAALDWQPLPRFGERYEMTQPTPFGRAWIRPVATQTESRTTGGYFISSKAGRSRPAIVVLPGSFRPAQMLQPAARLLADDYDMLLVDFPGFGATAVGAPASIASFADHAHDLLEAIVPNREVLLLGESIGAVVAMALGERLGARLRASVLLDPPVSAASLASARDYLQRGTAGAAMDAFFTDYVNGTAVLGDGGAAGYWPNLETLARCAPVLILSGGRFDWQGTLSPGALFSLADEATATAWQIAGLGVVRVPTAGHLLFQENPGESATAVKNFVVATFADIAGLAARVLAAPSDPAPRDALLGALRGFGGASLLSHRDALLACIRARVDDAELTNEVLRAVFKLIDNAGLATLGVVAAQASAYNTRLWACLHTAVSLSCFGESDAALDTLRAFPFPDGMPTRVAGLVLIIELYSERATDASVARAKEAHLATLRRHLPAPIARPAFVRKPGVPRVGMASGSFGSRNYMSLLLPLLREAAKLPIRIDLLPLVRGDLDLVRKVLPPETTVHDIEEITTGNFDQPAAWSRMSDTLAAFDYDLLIDLDESLVPFLPACVVRRPGIQQATWFNMSGPSDDACFDAAIGPASIYPPSLEAAFPGKIVALPGDLYVFEPEIWAAEGVALPTAGPPPSLRNGCVTFGSLSHLYKIGTGCIELWAKVLHAVPGSRLYLGNGDMLEMHVVERVRSAFQRQGIAPSRITFAYHFGWPRYLAGYQNIDIVLGTFPVAGGTTLFEAAHMGMPTLSRVGATSLGRIGKWLEAASGRVGIAHDSDESVVAEAVRLANAPDERAFLRANETARLYEKSKRDAARMAAAFLEAVETRFMQR